MSSEIDWKKLAAPFAPAEIEWRLQECGKGKDGKIWAKCFAYVTNRAIMDRLDAVVGPANWRNEFIAGPSGGVLCALSIKVDGEWITKVDGCDVTEIEPVKGSLSGAMKRAAVHFGLARYLYDLDVFWADVVPDGRFFNRLPKEKGGDSFKWNPPRLPDWATLANYNTPVDDGKNTEPKESENGHAHGDEVSASTKALAAIQNAHTLEKLNVYHEAVTKRTEAGEFTPAEFKTLEAALDNRAKQLKAPAKQGELV